MRDGASKKKQFNYNNSETEIFYERNENVPKTLVSRFYFGRLLKMYEKRVFYPHIALYKSSKLVLLREVMHYVGTTQIP